MTPSTPRTDPLARVGLGPLGLIACLLVVGAIIAWAWDPPSPPLGPRYVGAGDDTPRSGGTFVFSGGSNVRTLDPRIAYDSLSYMAIRLLFDGLLDYDREARIIPSLARELPEVSEDGRTFTFRLREGVRFHNGRVLTAEDVSWSMHSLLSEEVGSPGFPFYKSIVGAEAYHRGEVERIEGIRVLDPLTISFTLTEPDQTFLNVMAMPFAYPVPREHVEALEAEDRNLVGAHPVGTGPFRFTAWERGVQLEFARFEEYFEADRPNPDRMIFLENLTGEAVVGRFRNGDLDVVGGLPAVHYLFFRDSPAWKPYLSEYPGVTIFGLAMNCQMAPFDDVHVRRAVAFAIDREALRRYAQGRSIPAGQVLPPAIEGYDPDLPTLQRYDPERAREELRLAGYPDGLPESVEVWIGESEGALRVAQLWQQDLAAIGIRIELKQVAFAAYLEATGKPNTVAAFRTGWNMDFPDPSNFLDILFNTRSIHPQNSENRSFYSNPDLDRILDAARAEVDRERRLDLYREANEIVAGDAPWAFLSTPVNVEVWQPYVKGYAPHPIWSQDYRTCGSTCRGAGSPTPNTRRRHDPLHPPPARVRAPGDGDRRDRGVLPDVRGRGPCRRRPRRAPHRGADQRVQTEEGARSARVAPVPELPGRRAVRAAGLTAI